MTDNRQLARNLFFNAGTFFINLCLTFFLSPYLVRTVGKEAYGFYPLIGNIIGYSSIISSAIGSMAGRFITMSYYRKDYKEAQSYFNSVLFANLILSAFFAVLILVGIVFLPRIIHIPVELIKEVKWLFGLSGFSMLLGLIYGILGIGTYIKNRIDLSSMTGLASQVVYVLALICLFACFRPSVAYIAVGGSIGALFALGVNIHLKHRLLPEFIIRPFSNHSFSKIWELVTAGIWNSVNQLSNVLLTQLDLLISNIFISVSATGDYALVKVIPNFMYSFLAMLSGTFMPNFNILYAKGEFERLKQELQKSIKIVGYIVCIPLGFLLVFAKEFFSLWVPSSDAGFLAGLSFLTIIPMIFGASINPVFGVFTITNKLKVPSLVLLGAGILNTAAIFILLKTTSLGIWAIPLVGAIQHALRNFFFSPTYAAYCLNLKWYTFYPNIFKCCVGLGITAIAGLLVKHCMPSNSWGLLIAQGVLVALIAGAINMFIVLNKSDRTYLVGWCKSHLTLR